MKQPKYKKELREGIVQNVNSIKNVFALREVYKLTELLNRKHDEKQWETLTDLEWDQTNTVSDILRCDNPRTIHHIRLFVQSSVMPKKRRSAHE